jgi:hypothetical protein
MEERKCAHRDEKEGSEMKESSCNTQKELLRGKIKRMSVGDADPHILKPPRSGSGSISQSYGSGFGSFPFLINVLSGLK